VANEASGGSTELFESLEELLQETWEGEGEDEGDRGASWSGFCREFIAVLDGAG
jgi:hypothetical protein